MLIETEREKAETGIEMASADRRHLRVGRGIFFLLGMAFMGLVHVLLPAFRFTPVPPSTDMLLSARQPIHTVSKQHQPWGDFEYTKLPLAEPAEFLPDTAQPLAPPRWFFTNNCRQEILDLFNSCDLSAEQKELLLEPRCWQAANNGFYVSPPAQVVLEINRAARERIYGVLADSPVNSAQCHPFCFRPESFEESFADSGLGAEQMDLLRKLTYQRGGAVCFCDGAIMQRLLSANDFNRLVKALYGERTFLMRLRVTPATDLEGLVQYWGRAGRAQVLRPLLESMAQVPGGASINISYLLPPFARVRLYTYANPAADPTATLQNCFWTAMNFFSEKPDNRFLDGGFVQRTLASDYEQISGPPAFGDVVTVRDTGGRPIHMCVYLADDVVFTKNGRHHMAPWVLMKLPDMLASYHDKEPAQVAFFRSRKN